jgi:hypothetical protein
MGILVLMNVSGNGCTRSLTRPAVVILCLALVLLLVLIIFPVDEPLLLLGVAGVLVAMHRMAVPASATSALFAARLPARGPPLS